jgi:hypothetical protein
MIINEFGGTYDDAKWVNARVERFDAFVKGSISK